MMESNYKTIEALVDLDHQLNGSNVSLHLNKLTEEVGEFAQVVNKTLGIKKRKPSDTEESIQEDICEEASDVMQIIVGICILNGIKYEQLMTKLHEKNIEYRKYIMEKSSIV